jgi:hypothetical protein
LHEEFKRRIKTQTVLPSADTAAMMFWALLASGQIIMRKVDGWQTLATKPIDQPIASSRWRFGRVILMEIPVRMRKTRTRAKQMESLTGLLC